MSFATRQARSAATNARREGVSGTIIPADGGDSVAVWLATDDGSPYLDDATGAYEMAPVAQVAIADIAPVVPVPGDTLSAQGTDWLIDRVRPVAGMWQMILREMD